MKTLYRSKSDQKLAGVIGGISEYLNVDSNILRLATVILFFFTAGLPVLITYVVAWLILPDSPDQVINDEQDLLKHETSKTPETT